MILFDNNHLTIEENGSSVILYNAGMNEPTMIYPEELKEVIEILENFKDELDRNL